MSQDNPFCICVAGDPIHDRYFFGRWDTKRNPPRFVVTDLMDRRGGAANVHEQIYNLMKEDENYLLRAIFQDADLDGLCWPTIIRVVQGTTIQSEIKTPAIAPEWNPSEEFYYDCGIPNGRKGLVLVDYNHGYVSEAPNKAAAAILTQRGPFDYIIVDSRYGTYHPSWLSRAKMKILHATGSELDKHDPSLFNFVFHTDGANPIRLLHWGKHIDTIEVPTCPVVDPTGAGDMFVAYLATYLAQHCDEAWDRDLMIRACQEAIPHCQEVVGRLGV